MSDTLSMTLGKGRFSKISLYIDVHSQHTFGNPLSKAATGIGKSTCLSLARICGTMTHRKTFMTDGGPEFDNTEVQNLCTESAIKLHIVPAYSPWIDGLVEERIRLAHETYEQQLALLINEFVVVGLREEVLRVI